MRGMLQMAGVACLACIMFAFWGDVALGLDYNDVVLMKRNGIDEGVIINMVRKEPNLVITEAQADALRAVGASENLVLAIPRGTASQAATAQAPIYSTPVPATQHEVTSTVIPEGSSMTPVAIVEFGAMPGLYHKEGWLTVSNADWESYYLVIDQKAKRMFLSRQPNGGAELPSGHSVSFNLRKESYKLYGDTGNDLKVKIREGEATRVSLTPFGVVGNSGLNGIAQDRDKVRSEVLFSNYVPAPTVVVQEAPVIVVPGPPRYYRPYHGYGYGYRYW